MSDNVTANQNTTSGAVFATDDVSGVHYPIGKLAFGALDSVTLVTAAAGLPVHQQTGATWTVAGAVTNAGTFAVQESGAALTSLQLIDDAIYTSGSGTPTKGALVLGSDGTNPRALSLNTSGHVNIADGGNSITVDNGGTFAVQAALISGQTSITGGAGAVAANTPRVTLASDDTLISAVGIDGNASLPANAVIVGGHDGTQVRQFRATSGGLHRVQVEGSTAASIGKAEDAAHTTGDVGVYCLAVRSDTAASTAGTDGDYTSLITNASGQLWVAAVQSGTWSTRTQDGSGNALTSATRGSERALSVQIVDGSGSQITSFGGSGGTASNFGSADPSSGTAAGFSDGTNMREARVFDADSGAGTQYVLGVSLRKAASGGSVEAGTSSDPLRTDPTGTTAQPVTDNSGSLTVDAPVGTPVFVRLSDGSSAITTLPVSLAAGATNIAKAEDAASADADVGVPALAVRKATPANTSGTDGDYEFLQISAGRLWCSATIDAALPAGTNAIGKLASNTGVTIGAVEIAASQTLATVTTVSTVTSLTQMNGQAIAMGTGVRSAGTQRVTIATDDVVPASQSGAWTVQPGNTANSTPWLVTDTPATSGGLSQSHITAAANNNKTQVKGSAGQLYAIHAVNLTATAKYIKVFDKTSANVTAGTTSADYQFAIPANSTTGAGFVINLDKGVAHANGITVMITGGVSLTDNTSLSANDVVATFFYK